VDAVGYAGLDTSIAIGPAESASVDVRLTFSPLTLPPVSTVIEKLPHFGERPATSVAEVGERDLDRRAVNTVDEAIDHVPGFQFVNGQINIRGSTGYVQGLNSRVLLTVDVVPLNQGDHDVAGGRIAAGDRHSDGYRQQDHEDHVHVAGKTRWEPSQGVRVDISGALAANRYDVPLSWCSRGECDDRGQVFQPFKIDTAERG